MNFWIQVLIVAVLIDLISGEPPVFVHPVVWMGKLINIFVSRAPFNHRRLYGFFIMIFCTGAAASAGLAIVSLGKGPVSLVIAAFFLKSTFSIRFLLSEALEIKNNLENGMIEKVRRDLKTFVGRDTSALDEKQSASAVIESVSESFVDGILSPLFYFLLFGLPGALAYRMINTLDSMIGYRKEEFKELGYASALLDDAANWFPARLSLVFIFTGSIFLGKPLDALTTCIRDHNRTASPNSGWSMAATSGALNVRLEKIGHHVLGDRYGDPQAYQIKRAVYIVSFSSILVIAGIYFIGKVPLF
jgi:adenosylcobinamide-phosphate synthase